LAPRKTLFKPICRAIATLLTLTHATSGPSQPHLLPQFSLGAPPPDPAKSGISQQNQASRPSPERVDAILPSPLESAFPDLIRKKPTPLPIVGNIKSLHQQRKDHRRTLIA